MAAVSSLKHGIGAIALLLILVAIIIHNTITGYQVFIQKTDIMERTIKSGQYILINKKAYNNNFPNRWDIIGFSLPGTNSIAVLRVVGLQQEKISFKDNLVIVNEKSVTPPVQILKIFSNEFSYETRYFIPRNHVLLMGDNFKTKRLGFLWGVINTNQIIGKVFIDNGQVPTNDRSK